MPWWGGGFWAPNIGYSPVGYLPLRPPRRPPVHTPTRPGGRKGPYPLIAVNKRPPSGYGNQQPREHNVSATIAGHVVMPVRPVAVSRPAYGREPVTTGGYRPMPAIPGVRATTGVPGAVAGPGHAAPAPRVPSGSTHVSAPSHVSSGASSASHASSGGGGGGGGGSHGGGGGGGGGHH